MASEGVLNPKPTSLYHRLSFVAIFFPPSTQVREGGEAPGNATDHGIWY